LKLVKVFHFRHVDSLILLHLTQKNVITTYSKAARVFPSDHRQTASSRLIQFHWDTCRDSGAIVTLFMQDRI